MCGHCQMTSGKNYFKVKEVPDPDGSVHYLITSQYDSESVNLLANPCVITSANIQNGFEGMKRMKNMFFIEYINDSYQEK